MKTIADLKATLPQKGEVKWIGIRPQKKGPVSQVNEAVISVIDGLEGDHYSKEGGKRMITLIQYEHLKVVTNILKRNVRPEEVRRNIVVQGINLTALQDQRFRIGECIFQGTGFCHPCSRMETNLGPGGYNAMRGHGGITASVVSSGRIKTGDLVEILTEETT